MSFMYSHYSSICSIPVFQYFHEFYIFVLCIFHYSLSIPVFALLVIFTSDLPFVYQSRLCLDSGPESMRHRVCGIEYGNKQTSDSIESIDYIDSESIESIEFYRILWNSIEFYRIL